MPKASGHAITIRSYSGVGPSHPSSVATPNTRSKPPPNRLNTQRNTVSGKPVLRRMPLQKPVLLGRHEGLLAS